MPYRFKVHGADRVADELHALADDTRDMSDANAHVADELVPHVRARTRRRSGRLASSWRGVGSASSALFENDRPYAGPQEFGWPARRIEPTGAVASVVDTHREHIRTMYEEELETMIRRRGLA